MKVLFFIIIFILLIAVYVVNLPSLGTHPSKKMKTTFHSSKQYNINKGIFENRMPNVIAEMKKRSMSFKLIKEWFDGGVDRVPKDLLPEIKPDLKDFLKPSDKLKTIWFGHSTFLINIDGKIILIDPVFGKSAAPVSFIVKRFQKPVLELHELPKIDYILISHDHYDHLDITSIKYFVDKKTEFITPLGVGSHLIGWGIQKERITEKDWWDIATFDGVKFIATPAQHFSGRDGIHGNETLWASWVIQSKNHNIYFSGDSGYDSHFKEIGNKYGPFDVAFLESGQYNENWKEVHMLPREGIQAFKDLKAKKYFPVHWGMFELALHSWYEPIEKIYKLSKENKIELIAPMLGQIVTIDNTFNIIEWWKNRKSEVLNEKM